MTIYSTDPTAVYTCACQYHQANETFISNEFSQIKNDILGSVNALTMAHDNLMHKKHTTQNDPSPNDLITLIQPTKTQAYAVIKDKNLYDIIEKMQNNQTCLQKIGHHIHRMSDSKHDLTELMFPGTVGHMVHVHITVWTVATKKLVM